MPTPEETLRLLQEQLIGDLSRPGVEQDLIRRSARVQDARRLALQSPIKVSDLIGNAGNKLRYDIGPMAENMSRYGYDPNYPVVVQTLPDGSIKLVEGNHRVAAAFRAGLSEVPGTYELPPDQIGGLEKMLAQKAGGALEEAAPLEKQLFNRLGPLGEIGGEVGAAGLPTLLKGAAGGAGFLAADLLGPHVINAMFKRHSQPNELLQGALRGGSLGAGIGSFLPGVGTAIGGGVGAGLGALASQIF